MKEIIKAFEDCTADLIKFSNENVSKNAFNPSVQLIAVLSLLTSVLRKTEIKNVFKLFVELFKDEEVEPKGKQKNETSLLEDVDKIDDLLDSFDKLFSKAFNNYEERADASNDSLLKFMHLVQNG